MQTLNMQRTALPQRCGLTSRPAGRASTAAPRSRQMQSVCRAQKEQTLLDCVRSKAAAAAMVAALAAGSLSGSALANELDIMSTPKPTTQHIIDDAGVLNRTTKKAVNDELTRFEIEHGYRLEVVTVRKLEFENDAFGFADKVIEKWYPTPEEGNNKGLLLVVSTAKDGALSGGPKFMRTIGDELVDSIVSDNIPVLAEDAKFNEAVTSSLRRIEAKLVGEAVPPPPARKDTARVRTYKTKNETDDKKGVTGPIVLTLLFIAVVVPMLQYWGYTSED